MAPNGSPISSFTCSYAIFINTNSQNVDGPTQIVANWNAAGGILPNNINASPTPQNDHIAIFYNAQIHNLNTTHPPSGGAPYPPSSTDDPKTNPLTILACKLKENLKKILSKPLVTFLTVFGVGIALWGIVLALKANELSRAAIERADFSIKLQVDANELAKLGISWAYWSYNATFVGNRIALMGYCAENPNAFGCAVVNLWSGETAYLQNGLVGDLDPNKDNSSAPKPTSLPLAVETPHVLLGPRDVIDTASGKAVAVVGAVSVAVLLAIAML
ncbi:hypothetical protein BKA65DRAFT_557145 [Rhexocercosporidium sp. MPI-PUGE-AT-0058]|nr:hypothetical protein BKA65DRAFT_557145 [Rhexocercosporidium sp. MPI-PUGE-AT-0058]